MPHYLTFVAVERAERAAIPLERKPSDTIKNIKAQAEAGFGQPIIRLTFDDERLEHGRTLSDYNIGPGDEAMCSFTRRVRRRRA